MTNIDVRANVTVDEIVPVTLTVEERIDLVKKQAEDTKALLTLVNNTLSATSSTEIDVDVLGKIKPAIEQSSSTLEMVLNILATEPVDIEAAEGYSLDAYNLISDSASLLNISAPTTETITEVPVEVPSEATEVENNVEEEVGTSTSTSTEEVKEEVVETNV